MKRYVCTWLIVLMLAGCTSSMRKNVSETSQPEFISKVSELLLEKEKELPPMEGITVDGLMQRLDNYMHMINIAMIKHFLENTLEYKRSQ